MFYIVLKQFWKDGADLYHNFNNLIKINVRGAFIPALLSHSILNRYRVGSMG